MNAEASISGFALLAPGETPDVGFVPPLTRRRLSPLQKIFFALANAVRHDGADEEVVFASRDGEDTLTRRTVDDYQADGSVSPHRFSSSVYNAAPGLWSVQTRNRAAYTAIAAGDDTVECGLLETLLDMRRSRLLVVAEETGGGYGAAVRFCPDASGARRIAVGDGDALAPSMTVADLRAFLLGERAKLVGRWISLGNRP